MCHPKCLYLIGRREYVTTILTYETICVQFIRELNRKRKQPRMSICLYAKVFSSVHVLVQLLNYIYTRNLRFTTNPNESTQH